MLSDVANRQATPQTATTTPATPATPSAAYKWVGEVLDVGGTAGAVLPTSANSWDSYFDSPTVTKYTFHIPTESGDFMSLAIRGLEGEYRWTLSFESSVQSEVSALFTYYTDSANAKVQLVMNGKIVHNADFAGSTIIGTPVTLPIKQGPNRLSIAGDIYLDEVALYANAFLAKGFTTPL